jgi:hypothetical protein
VTSTYTPPREPRDRSRTHAAKIRTLRMRALRRAKYAGVSL